MEFSHVYSTDCSLKASSLKRLLMCEQWVERTLQRGHGGEKPPACGSPGGHVLLKTSSNNSGEVFLSSMESSNKLFCSCDVQITQFSPMRYF